MHHQGNNGKILSRLLCVGECFFFVFLVIIHFSYFAIPAYKKFRDAGVAVEVIEEDVGHLSLQAVAFCPYKQYSAWKNG